jgi:hypothetical protein
MRAFFHLQYAVIWSGRPSPDLATNVALTSLERQKLVVPSQEHSGNYNDEGFVAKNDESENGSER